jgi:hypothetical protein
MARCLWHSFCFFLLTSINLFFPLPRMLAEWAKQIVAKLASFDPHALASVASSFAALGANPSLVQALQGESWVALPLLVSSPAWPIQQNSTCFPLRLLPQHMLS